MITEQDFDRIKVAIPSDRGIRSGGNRMGLRTLGINAVAIPSDRGIRSGWSLNRVRFVGVKSRNPL